jgi:hypothetical protein
MPLGTVSVVSGAARTEARTEARAEREENAP